MNLIHQGPHAAADWLLIKLRSYNEAMSLHLLGSGQLLVRNAKTDRHQNASSFLGVYRNRGASYREVVEDLSAAANDWRQRNSLP